MLKSVFIATAFVLIMNAPLVMAIRPALAHIAHGHHHASHIVYHVASQHHHKPLIWVQHSTLGCHR